MRNLVIEALTDKFGEPTRETKKVLAWHITSGYGVVVENDQPKSGEYASVWLPDDANALDRITMKVDVYPEDKGRHSNTYATPGLERGKRVVKAKVAKSEELDELLDYLLG